MASYNMTINLGSGDDGMRRDVLYRQAAEKEGLSINAWAKKHLDQYLESLNKLDTQAQKA